MDTFFMHHTVFIFQLVQSKVSIGTLAVANICINRLKKETSAEFSQTIAITKILVRKKNEP